MEEDTLLLALRRAARKFPFPSMEVNGILATTRYNVVARTTIQIPSGELDYVLKTSLSPKHSYILQQVWGIESQRELERDLAPFVLPMLFVWGHGINGCPTSLCLQPYVEGRTLKEWSIVDLVKGDPRLLRQLSTLCTRIIARFLKTGAIIDTSGTHVISESWIGQKLGNIWWNFSFYNTTNVLIENGTCRVLLVDTIAPKVFLGLRQASGLKSKAKILVMFIGVVVAKAVFDMCRVAQRILVDGHVSTA